MKTVIFYSTDIHDSVTAVKYLVDDIKAEEEANHKLFFKFLFENAYYISMGCVDDEGKRHFIGEHEVIFMPSERELDIERLKQTKDVVMYRNCMAISGDKAKEFRKTLIDWLLEKKEDLGNENE